MGLIKLSLTYKINQSMFRACKIVREYVSTFLFIFELVFDMASPISLTYRF